VPAQFQQGNSEVRLERPDFAGDGALLTLIEQLLGQEKQTVLVRGFAQAGRQLAMKAAVVSLARASASGEIDRLVWIDFRPFAKERFPARSIR
jgi:hypothetical protein